MSNVVSFSSLRRNKLDADEKVSKPAKTKLRTLNEIYQDVFDDVISNWRNFAVKNRLNDYIRDKIPLTAKINDIADYVNDLNVISSVERKIQIKTIIVSPGATHSNPHGWLVSFSISDSVFSTPPDMASEANARALALVLFLTFTRELERSGTCDII